MPRPLRGHRQQARPPKMQRILGVKWYLFGSRLAGDEAGTSHRTLNRCPLGGRIQLVEKGRNRPEAEANDKGKSLQKERSE